MPTTSRAFTAIRSIAAALALSLLFAAARPAVAEPLTVFAAASLTDAMTEAGSVYEKETGEQVRFSFASSSTLARQIEAGFREIFPDAELLKLPVADGGEGTVEALVAATGGEIRKVRVSGPLGTPVEAFYGVCGNGRTAVIEMAAASGLALVPTDRRNPLLTSSFGTAALMARIVSWMMPVSE